MSFDIVRTKGLVTESFTCQDLSFTCCTDNEPEREQVYSYLFYANVGNRSFDYDCSHTMPKHWDDLVKSVKKNQLHWSFGNGYSKQFF